MMSECRTNQMGFRKKETNLNFIKQCKLQNIMFFEKENIYHWKTIIVTCTYKIAKCRNKNTDVCAFKHV